MFFCSPSFIMIETKINSLYNCITEYELKLQVEQAQY